MNTTRTFSAVLLFALAACAGTPRAKGSGLSANEVVTVNEYGEKVVCRKERPTGSNIPEMVCRSQAQIDAERLQTQDQLRTMPRPAGPGGN
jgi:hypothetical protein